MKLNEYQELAMVSCNKALTKHERLMNAALGLAGEAGEVADHLKKHLFQGHELDKAKIRKELGDLLWYVQLGADSLDVSLEEIAKENIAKLKKRYPDGFSAAASVNRTE